MATKYIWNTNRRSTLCSHPSNMTLCSQYAWPLSWSQKDSKRQLYTNDDYRNSISTSDSQNTFAQCLERDARDQQSNCRYEWSYCEGRALIKTHAAAGIISTHDASIAAGGSILPTKSPWLTTFSLEHHLIQILHNQEQEKHFMQSPIEYDIMFPVRMTSELKSERQ